MSEIMMQEETQQNLIDEAKRALSAQQFADEILMLREAAGLTQRGLAALIKVDKAVISRVENANHGVSLDLVMLLSVALKQDPHHLANIYWGISDDIYNDRSRFTLEQIKEILDKFYNLSNKNQHPPKHNPVLTTPEMQAEVEKIDRLVDEKKDQEKNPQNINQNPEVKED